MKVQESLQQKIEWLLNGGYLTDKGQNQAFAYGMDLKKKEFYSISKRAVKAKNPTRIIRDQHIPLRDIDENMQILRST